MSTLCLSGWAQPADALNAIADDAATFDYSDYDSLGDALNALKNIEHTKCVAWSLGGVVALHAIAAGVIAPTHLTLLATPYQFVQTPDYRAAMDALTYERFLHNYQSNPARTKERFLGLIAKGDADFKRVLGELRHHPDVENAARWLPWLQFLGAYRLDALLAKITTPTLIVHGAEDAIVAPAQAATLAAALPQATLQMWESTGHAPHLHDAKRLRTEITAHRKAQGV